MNETEHPPGACEAQRIRIGDLEIDLRFRCLAHPDGEVELPHRVFELLLLFVAEPHVLHTRQRLLDRVWTGLVVEDANLSQSVWMLRKALGPANKDWVRTVSKKGYVFEPPGTIQRLPVVPAAEAPQPMPSSSVPSSPVDAAIASIASASSPAARAVVPVFAPRRRRRAWAVAAALVVAGLVGLAARLSLPQAPAVATPRYVLIDGTRGASDAQARLPARLLEAWLGWKLAACPETRAATPAEWALPGREPIAMVILGSGALPGRDGRIFVQARIEAGDARHRIHREGPRGELARLVDEVSTEALHALLPARAREPWPALRVEPAIAERYLAFREARLAHRWNEAGMLGERLLRDAPGFELARLELAQTHAARGQLPQANALLDVATARLRPLPGDARALWHAYRLGLSPDHASAARAYAALAKAHPHRPQFAIMQALALARTGRFADGLAVLDRMRGIDTLSPEHAVARGIALAGLRATAGDHVGARISARAAARLAEAQGWHYERGHALMALANADLGATDGRDAAVHFEAAAGAFDAAGDAFSALHARAIGELHGPPVTGEPLHLEPWLARARAAGQRQLELDALRIAAYRHHRAGDLSRYRERLRQAQALSEAMGDRWGAAALAVDRLEDDFARDDRVAVDRGLARLAGSDLQGEPMLRARQIEATVAFERGDFARALAVLARGERDALGARASSSMSATAPLACTRASVLVRQGRPAAARAQYARCRDAGARGALAAAIGLAELEWISGDREAALAQARQARELLPGIAIAPDRWSASVELAGVLVRLGDARAALGLLHDVAPKLAASGLRRDATMARIALAEAALADGDPVRAAAEAGAIRASVSDASWRPRLRQVEVALARARGDEDAAQRSLAALHRETHRHGDLMHQALAHRWLRADAEGERCTERERAALVAHSGFRGASLDWLEGVRPARTAAPTLRLPHATRTFSRLD
jgi:DNA-binding winged helix-turn-helix (wHTH) protein/tetratricopeptide (TPR) repeat protein